MINKKRRGISEIVSTVILISAMLLIAVTTLIIANNMFNYQSQNVEFEQAKNVMINLASIIEGISGKVGSSGYVRFNTISGGPEFIGNAGSVTIKIGNDTHNLTIYQSSYSIFRYRGGLLVGTGYQLLRGTSSGIILNNLYPLGAVYTIQEGGAYIVLDYSRINVVKMGVYNFTTGINLTDYSVNYEALNLIQIHYIELVPGTFEGGGSINIVAKTVNVSTMYFPIYTDGILHVYFNDEKTSLNLDPRYDTMVIFVVSRIEINMFGG